MLKKIKQLAGDSVIYGFSGLITRFISVFLIPIYTRIFDPVDYGVINLVSVTFLLIGIFAVVGLDNAAARWYWDNDLPEERIATFSSWFWTQFLSSIAITIAIGLLSPQLSRLILKDGSLYYLFLIAALNLPFTCFILVYSTWLRVKRNAIGAVVFSLTNSLLTIGLSIYFVVFLRIGLKGVFLSQLIANISCSFIVLYFIGKNINPKYFGFDRIVQMLRFSIPLIPATISFWLLNSAGAYFINHYSSKADVGLYQIGSSIAAVCNIIFWAFLQAWSPFAMSILKQDDAPGIYSMVFDLYCSVGSLLVLVIFLFAPEILMVLTTKDYYNAALVSGILSFNIFVANIPQVTSIGCVIVKTNRPYAVGVVMASAMTVLLYMLMIPVFGKEGAAVSTLLGSVLMSIYITYKSQKLYFIPYHIGKNVSIIFLLIVLSLTSLILPGSDVLSHFFYKFFLLVLFLLFVLYLNKANIRSLVFKKTENGI